MTTTLYKRIDATINKLFPLEKEIRIDYVTQESYASIELSTEGDHPSNTVMINIDECYFASNDLEELIQLLILIQHKLEMTK